MNAKKPKVCVGMSGGVDSSVAAYLLKKEGYDVIGLTFRGWPQDCRSVEEDKCCGPQAVTDARMVAHSLDIPYYVVDEIDTFRSEVMDYFAAEYKRGRTPNPCVICNEKVKFGSLLRKAQALGAEAIATGHYARITRDGRYELRRARDDRKDQTYFLFSLNQDQLARAMFPIGELTKEQTRAVAKEIGLKTYGKEESQEVCFVPENDYRKFLRENANMVDTKGEIMTREGRVLGHHSGIHNFTIGQREGLNLGGQPRPLYVIELDVASNRVIVGSAEELLRSEFEVSNCVWHGGEPAGALEITVKPRHQHPGCKATVTATGKGAAKVSLAEAQRAITPGQAAVFYRGDLVVGGGWIC
ncbi:MAG TPA: tRNA 2-thiouridine(34) synthase MnmA [Verrucomicrobiae bacterium]|nr:tRNA 2-thiouridine(34) synthase MnmA [Verrucomicrobiae bacterium]